MIPAEFSTAFRACVAGTLPWPMFVHGPAGTGKTYSLIAALDAVGPGCRITTPEEWPTLVRLEAGEMADFKFFWTAAPIAAIDDLGARGAVSDAVYGLVKMLLDTRERVHGPLIVTSNLDTSKISAVFDDRIVSRLAAGTVVEITGTDRRI